MDVLFKSDKVEKYEVSFDEAQEYFFRTLYDLRIQSFINKKSALVKAEVKPKFNTKTKSKTKTKKVSD